MRIVNLGHSRLEVGYIAVILATALMIRFYPLSRGLGQDELYTAVNFVEAGSIWTTMSSNSAFNNHIGYSIMARLSNKLFGHSERSLRLPALLLGLASLYVFWLLGQSILTFSAATLATFVLALSPPHIIWSVEARGYSGMIFFSLLSSYLYLRLLRYSNTREACLYIAASVVGIYVHLYSVFTVCIQVLLLIECRVSKRTAQLGCVQVTPASSRLFWRSFIAIAGLSLIVYIPVAHSMIADLIGRGHGNFNLTFPWSLVRQLSGSEHAIITIFVSVIAAFGWYYLSSFRPLEARYFSALIVLPLLLMWLARPFDLYPRFFAYWLPYYILFFIAGLGALWNFARPDRSRWLGFLSRGAVATILLAVLFQWTENQSNYIPQEGYREASRAILADTDDTVRFCAIGGARSVWRYYIHQPITMPASVDELQKLSAMGKEIRCAYYEASWQNEEQTAIADFLRQHSRWQKVKDLTVFRYRAGGDIAALSPQYHELSGR
jgi:4-amino-4-deoxy-L-arabinose transferase-like glycosyltransferase